MTSAPPYGRHGDRAGPVRPAPCRTIGIARAATHRRRRSRGCLCPTPAARDGSVGFQAATASHQKEQRAAAEQDDRFEDGAAGSENHLRLQSRFCPERDHVAGFGRLTGRSSAASIGGDEWRLRVSGSVGRAHCCRLEPVIESVSSSPHGRTFVGAMRERVRLACLSSHRWQCGSERRCMRHVAGAGPHCGI
jgi:hypothetical protein